MSTKHSRSGGKFSGSHTTVIPLASIVADIAAKQPEVTKVTPGFIKAGLRSANGHQRVKITRKNSHILLSVRDNASHQELIVYTKDQQKAVVAIARGLRDARLAISFMKD